MTKRTHDVLFVIGLLIVPIVHFCLFWIYVNFSSISMSFINDAGEFTLEYFAMFFDELKIPQSVISEAILNTLKYFASGMIIGIPFAYVASYFIYKKILMYKYFRVVFFLPSIISSVILTALYSAFIAPDGVIGQMLLSFGMKKVPVFLADPEYATGAIMIYCLWTGPGTNLILFGGAMSRIPEEVMESASLDGVNAFQELWYFVIPLTISTLITVWTLSIAGIFMASGPILLFTQGEIGTMTLDYWIYDKVASYNQNFHYASAVGLLFTLVGTPITLISRKFLNKLDGDVQY